MLIVTPMTKSGTSAAVCSVSFLKGPASLVEALLNCVKDGVRLGLPALPPPTIKVLVVANAV